MKVDDIIKYDSGYDEGKLFDYRISKVWTRGFGASDVIGWVYLVAVSADASTHYTLHDSVPVADLKRIQLRENS